MGSILLLIGLLFKALPFKVKGSRIQRRFSLVVDYLVETVYDFFSDIL